MAKTCDEGAIGWQDLPSFVDTPEAREFLPVMKLSPSYNPLDFPGVEDPRLLIHFSSLRAKEKREKQSTLQAPDPLGPCEHSGQEGGTEMVLAVTDASSEAAPAIPHDVTSQDDPTPPELRGEAPSLTLEDLPLRILKHIIDRLDPWTAGQLAQTSRWLHRAVLYAGHGFSPGTRLGPDPWTFETQGQFERGDFVTSLTRLNAYGTVKARTQGQFRLHPVSQAPFNARDGKTYGAMALDLLYGETRVLTLPRRYVGLGDGRWWTLELHRKVLPYLWRETQEEIGKTPGLLRDLWNIVEHF